MVEKRPFRDRTGSKDRTGAKVRPLPAGTVTFLFTDIEGSTRLWEIHADAMRAALARHDALLERAITAAGGYIFKRGGDSFCAVFSRAADALIAALAAARAPRRVLACRRPDQGAYGVARRSRAAAGR